MFEPTAEQLARARFVGPSSAGRFSRLIVEKPIGRDLASAQAINDAIAKVFEEREIYRIDHYLGKETVQNILVLRFANSIFEPLFNQKYVDHMRRDAVETAWRWVMPILDRWDEKTSEPLPAYSAGAWGPSEADRLLEATGRHWRPL